MTTLLTIDDARSAVSSAGLPLGETQDETLVQTYIDAVTATIEDLSQPVVDVQRVKAFDGGRNAVLLPWPFATVVSVTENGAAVDSSDYVADGEAGIIYCGSAASQRSWAKGRRNVVVTVTVGVQTVPGNQKLAAMMLFAHLWRTRQGPRPIFNQQGGDVTFTPAGFAVPNAVAELLLATPRLPGFA